VSHFDSKFKCSVPEDACGISWNWKGPPGEHSPYPVEKFANGNEVLYCFLDVLVAFKIMSKRFVSVVSIYRLIFLLHFILPRNTEQVLCYSLTGTMQCHSRYVP